MTWRSYDLDTYAPSEACMSDSITVRVRRRRTRVYNIYSEIVVEWTVIVRANESLVFGDCVMQVISQSDRSAWSVGCS